jgi:hypothetical protein
MGRAAKKAASSLKVTAPLVQVDLGGRPARFYGGDVLPEGVSEDSIKHLESLGYVEKADAPSDAESDAQGNSDSE